MFIIQIIILLLAIFSVYHMWQHVPQSPGMRLLWAVLMILTGYGWIFYWLWFAIKRPEKRSDCGSFGESGSGGGGGSRGSAAGEGVVAQLREIYANESVEAKDRMDQMAQTIAREILVSDRSVAEKCRMLESVNAYTREFNAFAHNYIHVSSIYITYRTIEKMTGSMIFESSYSRLKRQFTNGELTELTGPYVDVLCAAGSLHQAGRGFSLKSDTLRRYDLPTIREDDPEPAQPEPEPQPEALSGASETEQPADKPAPAVRKVKVRKVAKRKTGEND